MGSEELDDSDLYETNIYGDKSWFKVDEETRVLHRLNGPALINKYGSEIWYKYGKIHREGGPAVIRKDGSTEWLKEGVFHRLDGPARIRPFGAKEYWIEGMCYMKEDWWEIISPEMKMKAIFNGEGV